MHKLSLTLTLLVTAGACYGQGMIQFNNPSSLTRFFFVDGLGNPTTIVPANAPINFGFFWGTAPGALSDTPVLPLGTMSAIPGIMTAPNGGAYPIPGTQPNDVIFARVRGWSSSFGNDWRAAMAAYNAGVAGTIFGQTDVRQLEPLGPPSGPGTVIWQSATATNPHRFYPLFGVPEPSTVLLGLLGLGSLLLLRHHKQ